ncbi:MAG: rhodanese-like domain-containing protein [Candidatus Dormibacteraceae bacterium]
MHIHPALQNLPLIEELPNKPELLAPHQLAELTLELSRDQQLWQPLVRHDHTHRWYELLLRLPSVEVWLIAWAPGQGTLPHDHGEANGALTVVEGALVEEVYADTTLGRVSSSERLSGTGAEFASDHIHRVTNKGKINATTIHAYSPPERPMRYYGRPVEELLEEGALLVDIRPEGQRQYEGEIPGAVAIERNWLEWRLDPASPDRIPEIQDYSQPIIIFCSKGYASSFAASSLRQLGMAHVSDLAGGYHAWAAAGLPTRLSGDGELSSSKLPALAT